MGRREAPLQAAVQVLASDGTDAAYTVGDVRNSEDAKKLVDAAVRRCEGRRRRAAHS